MKVRSDLQKPMRSITRELCAAYPADEEVRAPILMPLT